MAVTLLLLALVLGTIVYCVLVAIAARRYLASRPPALAKPVPISVLKPLFGVEDSLENHLRTFFVQQYPKFEILFAVREESDPAVAIVERLRAEFRNVASRLIVTGEPPWPNAKVFSLDCMKGAARHDLLVMSDSDVRVTPDFLATIAAEFQDKRVGLVTCPYRAIAGPSPWSRLEAAGMNTMFLGGVLVARMLEGMKFALGPTIAARRGVVDAIGGFERLKDYLAEDFVMGKLAAEKGHTVILSSYVIEHHIGSQGLRANLAHRLRWARSTRRSRPKGYVGELFTMPLVPAVLLTAWDPQFGVAGLVAVLLRFWSGRAVCRVAGA
ncbi:MAG: glycosyltransferase, partial [Bryobacteraceae bacterium]